MAQRQFTAKQWTALAAFIGSLAAMVTALPHWDDSLHPPFIGALLMNVSAFLAAFFSDKQIPRRGKRDGVSPDRFVV